MHTFLFLPVLNALLDSPWDELSLKGSKLDAPPPQVHKTDLKDSEASLGNSSNVVGLRPRGKLN